MDYVNKVKETASNGYIICLTVECYLPSEEYKPI